MANQNYQQTEMDLRTNLQQDVDCRVASVIDDTYDMLLLCSIVSFASFPAEKVSKGSDGCEGCDGQDCSKH